MMLIMKRCYVMILLVVVGISNGSFVHYDEHFLCEPVSWHTRTKRHLCVEAEYMIGVHNGLKDNGEVRKNSRVASIYNAIMSMYDELRFARTPTMVNLGAHVHNSSNFAVIHAISSCIPEENIIQKMNDKTKPFGHSVGFQNNTQMHLSNISRSYEKVESSFFVLAQKNVVGWDSPKNLETLALGSVPLFLNIRHCPHSALTAHPKQLYQHLLSMPGLKLSSAKKSLAVTVHNEQVKCNVSLIDMQLYRTVVSALLHYTHNVLTTKAMAAHMLHTVLADNAQVRVDMNASAAPPLKVLYLTHAPHERYRDDFLTDLMLHGLVSLLRNSSGSSVTDYPRRPALYFGSRDTQQSVPVFPQADKHSWDLRIIDFQSAAHRDDAEYAAEVRAGIVSRRFDLVFIASDHHRDELRAEPLLSNTSSVSQRPVNAKLRSGSKRIEKDSGTRDAGAVEFYDLLCEHYPPQAVAYIDGSEHHLTTRLLERYAPCVGHFFSREGYLESN